MRAPQVRKILASISFGKTQRVDLGPGDTPRSLRNYFLVIAKLEGYIITTQQHATYIQVCVQDYKPKDDIKAKRENSRMGTQYSRPKNNNDFNWPCLELSKLGSYDPCALLRIDLTPKPVAGQTVKPVGFNRGNTNGFKRKHQEENYE